MFNLRRTCFQNRFDLSVSPFSLVKPLLFDTHAFRIVLFNWCIDHVIIIKCPFLFLIIFVSLGPILFDLHIATPAVLFLVFAGITFSSFYFESTFVLTFNVQLL